jgi:hypothetical protein
MTIKISPRAISLRSDANNAAKGVRAGDHGFETGQKTGTIHACSALSGLILSHGFDHENCA